MQFYVVDLLFFFLTNHSLGKFTCLRLKLIGNILTSFLIALESSYV